MYHRGRNRTCSSSTMNIGMMFNGCRIILKRYIAYEPISVRPKPVHPQGGKAHTVKATLTVNSPPVLTKVAKAMTDTNTGAVIHTRVNKIMLTWLFTIQRISDSRASIVRWIQRSSQAKNFINLTCGPAGCVSTSKQRSSESLGYKERGSQLQLAPSIHSSSCPWCS